jgi:phosphoglycerol transferase MdoB-like AlkP superfamily enzyme
MWQSMQMRCLFLFGTCWLGIFTLTRLVLLFGFHLSTSIGWHQVPGALLIGAIYDVGFLTMALAPLATLLLILPGRWAQSRYASSSLIVLLGISLYAMWFIALSEWFFWEEFGVRFNFIAVDYLVYSNEVIDNIRESYPLPKLLSGIGLISLLCVALLWPLREWLNDGVAIRGRQCIYFLGTTLLSALISAAFLHQDWPARTGGNAYARELSRNGPFQFFAAFRNNELNFHDFYAKLSDKKAGNILREELANDRTKFLSVDPQDIRRWIDNPGELKKYNIVLITIESLSAKYLGSFGDLRQLTPHLDELRKQSVFFNNFYATGTRTDRGLEAVSLSIPSTPGRSILKRMGHETGYASLGQQLANQGYDVAYIYGGRGYFDNMNSFFGGNGYRIVDQSSVPEEEIHFKNAWGMADEDLFAQALKQANTASEKHQPFFFHVMTTSNHRPYTYPNGRIDIPSGNGRDGAVKYTDYAIGKFIHEAQQKSWFKNTIFVLVADHCAGSAGNEDLPIANYHIPLWIYAPDILPAREEHYLSSQIDIAPTLLGLLNMDYESTFYGRDLFFEQYKPGRALVANYQNLGFYDGTNVAILSPKKMMRLHEKANGKSIEHSSTIKNPLIERDIAYYQSASYAYQKHLNAWNTLYTQNTKTAKTLKERFLKKEKPLKLSNND